MNDVRGFVKCALGFIVAIVIVAGAVFGFDVDVKVEDTNDPTLEECQQTSTKKAEKTTSIVTSETTTPADSTPTEDKTTSVDKSKVEDVTQSTDNAKDVVTEGEKNNA